MRALWALVVTGCSQILGLSAPQLQGDGGTDGVVSSGDFAVSVSASPAPRVPSGGFDFLTVQIVRDPTFTAAVTVDIPMPPAGVTTMPVTIPTGSSTAQLKVTGAPTLTIGTPVALDIVATSGALKHDAMVNANVTIPPGAIDSTFGGTGIAQVQIENRGNTFFDVSVQPDGTIVAVGESDNAITGRGTVARLNSQGGLDTTFNPAGGQPGTLELTPSSGSAPSNFNALARHDTTRILAGGQGHSTVGPPFQPWAADLSITDGSLVAGFGSGGQLLIQPDDPTLTDATMVAMATITSGLVVMLWADPSSQSTRALIGRTLANGKPDSGFADFPDLGLVAVGDHAAMAIDHTSAQKIYVVGVAPDASSHSDIRLVRVTETGTLDPSFGTAGVVTAGDPGVDDVGIAVAVEADGVVVAGHANNNFVLRRFHLDGTPDTAFGTNGVASPPITDGANAVTDMAVQADGKILVVGNATGGSAPGPILARYLPDGTLDPTYGTNGVAAVFLGTFGAIFAVDLQPDGSAIAVGGIGSSFPTKAIVARFGF